VQAGAAVAHGAAMAGLADAPRNVATITARVDVLIAVLPNCESFAQSIGATKICAPRCSDPLQFLQHLFRRFQNLERIHAAYSSHWDDVEWPA